jgi:SAM-dependent methyltransferase
MTTLTLLVLQDVSAISSDPAGYISGADELIEVGNKESSPLRREADKAGLSSRYIRSDKGISYQLNIGISFSSSEWITVCFSDETLRSGWIHQVKDILKTSGECVHLFKSDRGASLPLAVIRREAFVYGSIDERFPAQRLAILHWVHRIYNSTKRNISKCSGISKHYCNWLADGWPSVEYACTALIELWHDLGFDDRTELLNQVLLQRETLTDELSLLKDHCQKRSDRTMKDPYRSHTEYRPREFWEANTADYIRWEVFQPDEEEIKMIVERTAPMSVLELGCGAGRNTRYFDPAQYYVGIDLSFNLLERSLERQLANSLGVIYGDIVMLPFRDNSFSLVFADSTIQHVPPDKIDQCVKEMTRVSSNYMCLIEYTEEIEGGGNWFEQIHMFSHDYARLFPPDCELVLKQETSYKVQAAKKELFLFKKRIS